MSNLREEFEKEAEKTLQSELFSAEYKRKRLVAYLIRTSIAILIIYFLWDYEWMYWVLWIYIPLNIFSLISIFGWEFLLKRKMKRIEEKLETINFEEE